MVLAVVARLLLGPSLMVAAALIVKGYTDVGDGFAAGMVVALAIALCYVALGAASAEKALPPLRYAPQLAVAGLLLSLAVGFFRGRRSSSGRRTGPVSVRAPTSPSPAAAPTDQLPFPSGTESCCSL
ncbi:MnhB domain-containing protein [Streptomyces sp. NPDC058171]